jgi:manganese/iron transport system permease protein
MLIGPGATAYLLTDSFERMLVIATAFAVAAAGLGTVVSFHIDGATGACIVLIQAFFFLLAFLFAPSRGILRKAVSPRTGDPDPVAGLPLSRD